MTLKIISKKSSNAFEDACNETLSKGYEFLSAFVTPDNTIFGVFENGKVEIQAEKAIELDKGLVKENKSLNNTIASLEKDLIAKDKALDKIKDDFNAKIEVLQGNIQKNGDSLQDEIDQLAEINEKAGKESIELLSQLEAADKHNTELSLNLETCKKECSTLKASNTKLKKKVAALIEEE